ncbi:MAG: pyridoxamine 5'-phosphate oxidase family protein [Planctomycetota bacterium]|nr:pyridoxamine 5'-phosphate oxidase family protein [Planctomycetota bacterium]
MSQSYKHITYTDSVKEAQTKAGTRVMAQRMADADWGADRLSERESAFIAQRDGFYLASVNEDGWPYVQFRGGPSGFLKILDASTLAYADFRGNLQMLSMGNIAHEERVSLFLMDYANRKRLKILARAEVIDRSADPALLARLHDSRYAAHPERAIVFHLVAFDWNCPQHITPRFTLEEIERLDLLNIDPQSTSG